jgi:hypothetical protein
MITQESQNWGSKLHLKVKERIPDNYRRTTSGRRKKHQRWELEQRTIKQFSWTIEQLTICFIPQHPLWWSACPPPHHLLLHGPSCKEELKRTALDGESWNLNWIGRPVEPVPVTYVSELYESGSFTCLSLGNAKKEGRAFDRNKKEASKYNNTGQRGGACSCTLPHSNPVYGQQSMLTRLLGNQAHIESLQQMPQLWSIRLPPQLWQLFLMFALARKRKNSCVRQLFTRKSSKTLQVSNLKNHRNNTKNFQKDACKTNLFPTCSGNRKHNLRETRVLQIYLWPEIPCLSS